MEFNIHRASVGVNYRMELDSLMVTTAILGQGLSIEGLADLQDALSPGDRLRFIIMVGFRNESPQLGF